MNYAPVACCISLSSLTPKLLAEKESFSLLKLKPKETKLTSQYLCFSDCDLSLSPHARGHERVSNVIINGIDFHACPLSSPDLIREERLQ